MPQIVLHLILLSNHKKSKKERRITEIFLQRIPFSLKNHFCLGDVWLSLILRCAKQRRRVPASGLALSVIASRCHLSQSERPWQSAKFPVYTLRPAAARGAVRRCAQTSRLCQGLSLWESWREAPERASPLSVGLRVSFDQTYDKSQCRPLRRGGALQATGRVTT